MKRKTLLTITVAFVVIAFILGVRMIILSNGSSSTSASLQDPPTNAPLDLSDGVIDYNEINEDDIRDMTNDPSKHPRLEIVLAYLNLADFVEYKNHLNDFDKFRSLGYTIEGLEDIPGYQGVLVTEVKLTTEDGNTFYENLVGILVNNELINASKFRK